MSYYGSEFYDNDSNFENYMERRQGKENANDTLEKPVMWEFLGDVIRPPCHLATCKDCCET